MADRTKGAEPMSDRLLVVEMDMPCSLCGGDMYEDPGDLCPECPGAICGACWPEHLDEHANRGDSDG